MPRPLEGAPGPPKRLHLNTEHIMGGDEEGEEGAPCSRSKSTSSLTAVSHRYRGLGGSEVPGDMGGGRSVSHVTCIARVSTGCRMSVMRRIMSDISSTLHS